MIAPDRRLPVDHGQIPLEHLADVQDTGFDVCTAKTKQALDTGRPAAPRGRLQPCLMLNSDCAAMVRPAALLTSANGALNMALFTIFPASYVVVHDVRGDSWGYEGETQEYRPVRGEGP